jgi:CRP-like cAMP-binding protein
MFQGVAAAVLPEIAALARTWSVPRRAVLFREGDPALEFPLVCGGRVKLTQRTRGGTEVIVRVVGEGEPCAWPDLLAEADYLATAIALEPAQVLVWERAGLEALFERFPVLSRSAMRVLSRRLAELQDRYRELATERVPQRLELTGTTLFTVSRLLGQWEKAGVLSAHRERVVVGDLSALARLASPRANPRSARPHS